MFARVSDRLRDPVAWTSTSQLFKAALAAVIAWVVAVRVFGLAQGFMAPWAALLTLHATVFGTMRRGVQQAAAAVVGVLIAFLAGRLFGLNEVSLGAAVVLGLVAGSVRGLRAETTTAATTAIVVLTTGYSDNGTMLANRLLDTGIGIMVGLLVNLIVWPPLRDRAAAHAIDQIDDRLGELLSRIARELALGQGAEGTGEWIACADELDADIKQARRRVDQARESGRLNPRRAARHRIRATEDFGTLLARLEQAVSETRSMARTIQLATPVPAHWDPRFRESWLDLLEQMGAAIAHADADAIRRTRTGIAAFAKRLTPGDRQDGLWPVYGALLINLRNVADALDVVAEAQPVEVPPPASAARARLRSRRPPAQTVR